MKDALKQYRGLNKSIYVIFIAQIINSLGAFVFPFMTMFLTDKLNYSSAVAGRYVTLITLEV